MLSPTEVAQWFMQSLSQRETWTVRDLQDIMQLASSCPPADDEPSTLRNAVVYQLILPFILDHKERLRSATLLLHDDVKGVANDACKRLLSAISP
jgi:hypothetical protein